MLRWQVFSDSYISSHWSSINGYSTRTAWHGTTAIKISYMIWTSYRRLIWSTEIVYRSLHATMNWKCVRSATKINIAEWELCNIAMLVAWSCLRNVQKWFPSKIVILSDLGKIMLALAYSRSVSTTAVHINPEISSAEWTVSAIFWPCTDWIDTTATRIGMATSPEQFIQGIQTDDGDDIVAQSNNCLQSH